MAGSVRGDDRAAAGLCPQRQRMLDCSVLLALPEVPSVEQRPRVGKQLGPDKNLVRTTTRRPPQVDEGQPLAPPADDGAQLCEVPTPGFRVDGRAGGAAANIFTLLGDDLCLRADQCMGRRLLSKRSVIGKRPEIRPAEHELAKVLLIDQTGGRNPCENPLTRRFGRKPAPG